MKTISIVGSCNSRELFNYDFMKKEFQIDFYAFQTNIWDMFSQSLNITQDFINQIPMEQFFRRMFDLDVNKRVPDRLKEKNSEYLIIDFFIMTREILKITYNGNSVYINHVSYQKIHDYINCCGISNLTAEITNIVKIGDDVIFKGFDKFAEFIKDNYDVSKIIVVNPVFHTKYLDKNGNLLLYNNQEIETIKEKQKIVNRYTDYFVSRLPGCKKLTPKFETDYACFRLSDIDMKKPNYTHHAKHEELGYAYQMYELLCGKSYDGLKYNALASEYDDLNNKACKLSDIVHRFINETLTSINNYFYNILDLKKYIVIISVRDEASKYLHKFIAKNKLKLNFPIAFRQSYIGIVDEEGDYYYEECSDKAIEKEYTVGKNRIKVKSAGFLCGNSSSVTVNEKEYSLNKRGLNFVIIDNRTFDVVNSFTCDTHGDEEALISLKPRC